MRVQLLRQRGMITDVGRAQIEYNPTYLAPKEKLPGDAPAAGAPNAAVVGATPNAGWICAPPPSVNVLLAAPVAGEAPNVNVLLLAAGVADVAPNVNVLLLAAGVADAAPNAGAACRVGRVCGGVRAGCGSGAGLRTLCGRLVVVFVGHPIGPTWWCCRAKAEAAAATGTARRRRRVGGGARGVVGVVGVGECAST